MITLWSAYWSKKYVREPIDLLPILHAYSFSGVHQLNTTNNQEASLCIQDCIYYMRKMRMPIDAIAMFWGCSENHVRNSIKEARYRIQLYPQKMHVLIKHLNKNYGTENLHI